MKMKGSALAVEATDEKIAVIFVLEIKNSEQDFYSQVIYV